MNIQKIVSIFWKPVLTLLLGVVLAFMPTEFITEIFFAIFGVVLLSITISPFIQAIKELKYKTDAAYEHFFSNLVIIVLSILMVFLHEIIEIALGITLLIFAILNIIINKDSISNGLKNESIKIALGIILIIFGFAGIMNIVLTIVGWVLIVTSIIGIILEIVAIKRGYANDKHTE